MSNEKTISDAAQAPIYQTCFIYGQWRDVDRAEYDRAKSLRDDLARIVYAAPTPTVAADAAAPTHADFALRALVAAGHVTQGKVDEALAIASKTPGVAQPDERAATWLDAFNERHQFDVYPDDFMTGLRNEFCAGWQANKGDRGKEYSRGLREAFNVANGIAAGRSKHNAEAKISEILRALANLANGANSIDVAEQVGVRATTQQANNGAERKYTQADMERYGKCYADARDARRAAAPQAVTLSVWYGSMPESNGKSNWTAILHNGDITYGFTIARSEYPDRVRYEADCVRWLIGELEAKPFILDYDADKHSGYVERTTEQRMSDAARDVLAERERQVIEEGWTPDHDDEHDEGEMASAAAAYAAHSCGWNDSAVRDLWPPQWHLRWLKTTDPRRDLVKAGALILAEIERRDRIAARKGASHG